MKQNFLPLGSVCSLNNGNNLVMIVGYHALEYGTELKNYDYYGCYYPVGITSINKMCLFNQVDIKEVLFEGYNNDETQKFLNNVSSINITFDNNVKTDNGAVLDIPSVNNTNNLKPSVVFDENGYVISENISEIRNPFKNAIKEETVETVPENTTEW